MRKKAIKLLEYNSPTVIVEELQSTHQILSGSDDNDTTTETGNIRYEY